MKKSDGWSNINMDCFNKLNLQWSQGLRFKNFKNVSPSRLSPVMVNDMALRVYVVKFVVSNSFTD